MNQFVPTISENDIKRIIARDFPLENHATIFKLIEQVDMWDKTRIVMACLKNAKGDMDTVKGELMNASGYYREIISEAEYPNYTKKWFYIDKLSPTEVEDIIEKDKKQYLSWLNKEEKTSP